MHGWPLYNTPLKDTCGNSFHISHALSCPKGGFPSVRHNWIRDFTAHLGISLLGISANSTNGARLDVTVNEFWGERYERTLLDFKIFNPHADSNRSSSLPTLYLKRKNEKRRMYEQRVHEVEHASLCPDSPVIHWRHGQTSWCVLQMSSFSPGRQEGLALQHNHELAQMFNHLLLVMFCNTVCEGSSQSSFHRPDYCVHIDLIVLQSHFI